MKPDIQFRPITYRPVTIGDIPLLRRWIAQPHWQEWWGDIDQEIGYIENMLAGRDTTRPYIFHIDGEDLGYIQAWKPEDHLFDPWLNDAPWMADLPKAAIGIDLAIGDITRLSQGLGTMVLKGFVAKLNREGHQTITIDPDSKNLRAVRAYEKAGFCAMPEFLGKTGDILLMQYEGPLL